MEWGYIFSCRLSSFLFARWYHYRPSWAWFLWCHADRQRWPFPFVLTRGPFAEQACSWTCSRSSLSTELTEDPESCMLLTWIWNNKKGVDGKMLSLLCWSAWFNINRSLEDESMLHFFSGTRLIQSLSGIFFLCNIFHLHLSDPDVLPGQMTGFLQVLHPDQMLNHLSSLLRWRNGDTIHFQRKIILNSFVTSFFQSSWSYGKILVNGKLYLLGQAFATSAWLVTAGKPSVKSGRPGKIAMSCSVALVKN